METRLLEGRPLAAQIREETSRRISELTGGANLSVVLVGDDAGSRIYSQSLERAAGKLGMGFNLIEIGSGETSEAVVCEIRRLSDDPSIHGVIVLEPLPAGIPGSVVEAIAPEKDVDCATTLSFGLLVTGRPGFVPCTALAVLETLGRSGIDVAGKHVVIVGRSTVVGRPLANLLLRKCEGGNATVTVCHTATRDLGAHTRSGDIVVAAMGRPEAIRGDMISEGAVVVDVGVNRIDDPGSEKGYRIVGDVAFDEVMGRASALTPVPGGVGRLTTALLLSNVVAAAEATGAVS